MLVVKSCESVLSDVEKIELCELLVVKCVFVVVVE